MTQSNDTWCTNGCGNNNTSVLEMIADENTVMIKAAHLKKEKV